MSRCVKVFSLGRSSMGASGTRSETGWGWVGVVAAAVLIGTSVVAHGQSGDAGLLSWWTFSSDRQQGASIKAWVGGPDITPSGPIRFISEPRPAHLELPGQDERLVVAETVSKALLPRQDLTIESWVRVDRAQEWGGIFSAIQDNGEFERGLLLGYRGDRFALGVSTEAAGKLTYLSADQPFVPGLWHHVVGTYDGKIQRLMVNGRLAGESTNQLGPVWYAPKGPVVIGAYQDDDEFYRMKGGVQEVRVYQRAMSVAEVTSRYEARKSEFPKPKPEPVRLRLVFGPFVDWVDASSVVVTWETEEEMPSVLELFSPFEEQPKRSVQSKLTRRHEIKLTGLERNTEYRFRLVAPPLGDREHTTRQYVMDTSFYYRVIPAAGPKLAAGATEPTARAVADLLSSTGVTKGWCVVLGGEDGRLALELVRQSELKVLVVDSDEGRVQAIRKRLDDAGVYGVRASVQWVTTNELPLGPFMANLVVSETTMTSGRPPRWSANEIHRLLRPAGGVAWLRPAAAGKMEAARVSEWKQWVEGSELGSGLREEIAGVWVDYRRAKLAGAGDWSHQYGSADNTSSSMDEQVQGDLQISWWGDPGPRPMPDRGPRNPAPLSVNGRLYIQGDRILFGLDAYNGSILWSFMAPEVRRSNLPRDCSNMVADDHTLYVAHKSYCIEIDGQTGVRRKRLAVPESGASQPFDWGYLAVVGPNLIGSRVKLDSRYQGDDGEWFEDYHEDQVSRVTSEALFGMDPKNGAQRWIYRKGAILNSTITVGDEMIFFIESRNPAAVNAAVGRLSPDILTDTHLVALDMRTGSVLWEQPHDVSKMQFMTYLVYSQNTLVATGTDKSKVYHTQAYSAPARGKQEGASILLGGQVLWTDEHKEDKGHHSGHLQHPVVIDGVFYSDQRSFDLKTGKTLRTDLPQRRGCGTMSAGKNAIFFRHHFHGMWDLKSDKRTQFEGIRSGCWLGLIPAGGMLLAPETSAGCSCTHAIQTSMGYLPKDLDRGGGR